MRPHAKKKSNDISSEIAQQINSNKSCMLIGRVSTKGVKRIVKFQILDFALYSFSLTWDHVRVKVSNEVSCEIIHQLNLRPKLMYNLAGWSLPKVLNDL